MKQATFNIHHERAEHGMVWWAESDEVGGLSVAAPTLHELTALIDEAVALELGPGVEVKHVLAPDPVAPLTEVS